MAGFGGAGRATTLFNQCVRAPPPPHRTPAVIAKKKFCLVGDKGDGGADATLPGASSPFELVIETSLPAGKPPLDACAAAGITVTLIGGSAALNGAPLAVGTRVPLPPGAKLFVDGGEWEVHRNEHAHA